MEEKALFSYTYFDTKELKEREESYNKCLESDDKEIPSLKYAFYNLNMLNNYDTIEEQKCFIKEKKSKLMKSKKLKHS